MSEKTIRKHLEPPCSLEAMHKAYRIVNGCEFLKLTGRKRGLIVGSMNGRGYVKLSVPPSPCRIRSTIPRSYAVWWMTTGIWPMAPTMDHIDRNRMNDRIENLRQATYEEQSYNQDRVFHPDKGVREAYNGKYTARACLTQKGPQVHLGTFDTRAEARAAVQRVDWATKIDA
mgnify:CR=1 FL=1